MSWMTAVLTLLQLLSPAQLPRLQFQQITALSRVAMRVGISSRGTLLGRRGRS